MKTYLFIFLSTCFVSYGQVVKQDKTIIATTVYGYFSNIEEALENIEMLKPELITEVNKCNYLLTTNFGKSKINAESYLNGLGNWKEIIKPKMDSIKMTIFSSIFQSNDEELKIYLKELENTLKGNIPSPILEYILSFQYENQPNKEFLNGFTYNFSTKNHKKSKNSELILSLPKSWSSKEGLQPNVIQLFTSDCGNGLNTLAIVTQDLPINKEDLIDVTFDEIDKYFSDEFFTEEYAKSISSGNLLLFEKMSIAGRSGFLVVSEDIKEKMGVKLKIRQYQYVFHDLTHLHFVTGGTTTNIINENLEEKAKKFEQLLFLIINSIVVPKKSDNIIYLQGTTNQKTVDIKIDNINYDFILDTGASISLISKNIINKLLENGIISNRNFIKKDYTQTADGKKHLVEFWNLPNIIINGRRLNDVDFAVMEGNIELLLGMNILNKLSIWKIELENNKIYLNN